MKLLKLGIYALVGIVAFVLLFWILKKLVLLIVLAIIALGIWYFYKRRK